MPEQRNRQFLVVGLVVIIALIGIGYLLAGARGVGSILNFLKWAVIAVLIVGLAVWGAWYLFIRKVRDDRVALNVKKVIEQAKLTKPKTLRDLWISGDKEHPEVKLGKIVGYTKIENSKFEEEDVFVFQKMGFPFSLFEEPKVVRVTEDQRSRLIGDVVIEGISLVQHGGFYYVNTDHLDVKKIDETIKQEVFRKFTFDVLRDIKIISDMGIGINPEHQKYIEGKSLLKLPARTEPLSQGEEERSRQ